ncbi:hypothetical protein [Actinomadura atramentaria]|uniref:hypothetical protein n=1 Tax=Actinomadura atramentaria TaxID=1990 RepID=UPI000367CDAE|nr:hypothetical protein [Actinomadura atramentaria]
MRTLRLSRDALSAAAPALPLGYAAVRAFWLVHGFPFDRAPIGSDLVSVHGWDSVALCCFAALIVAAARRMPARVPRPLVVAAGWGTAAVLAGSAALLLLDVVGAILPGLGLVFEPLGALSRAACAGCAVLTARATLAYQRRTRTGRTLLAPLSRTPRWAFVAAYAASAGCLVRIAAQAWVGLETSPLRSGTAEVLFELGFVLGGTLLPAALVHAFGRTWPRWVPVLARRRVPRRLVLWPGAAVSAGLIAYFGTMTLQMIWERLHGRNPFPPSGGLDLPEAFFWIAVPGYLVWGIGLAAASVAYARRTKIPDAAASTCAPPIDRATERTVPG